MIQPTFVSTYRNVIKVVQVVGFNRVFILMTSQWSNCTVHYTVALRVSMLKDTEESREYFYSAWTHLTVCFPSRLCTAHVISQQTHLELWQIQNKVSFYLYILLLEWINTNLLLKIDGPAQHRWDMAVWLVAIHIYTVHTVDQSVLGTVIYRCILYIVIQFLCKQI